MPVLGTASVQTVYPDFAEEAVIGQGLPAVFVELKDVEYKVELIEHLIDCRRLVVHIVLGVWDYDWPDVIVLD